MEKEKFLEIGKKWSEISDQLREESVNYLERVLKEQDGQRLSWNWEELENLGIGSVTVSYDGGNHPEYASDCFCTVEGVHINKKNGKVCVDIEESSEYSVDRISVDEVYDVAWIVSEYLALKDEQS